MLTFKVECFILSISEVFLMRYHILKDNRPATFEKQVNVVQLYKKKLATCFCAHKLYIFVFLTVSFKCTMICLIESYF